MRVVVIASFLPSSSAAGAQAGPRRRLIPDWAR